MQSPKPAKPREKKKDAKTAYHHGDLRAALTEKALALVRKRGIEAFSLREAAERVGVSPSAVYRHFADKGALLAAVAKAGFTALAVETEAAITQAKHKRDGDLAILDATGISYLLFALAHPEQFRVMFGPYGAGSKYDVRVTDSLTRGPYQQLIDALTALEKQNRLRLSVDTAALQAWSFTHGLAYLLLDGVLPLPEGDAANFVAKQVSGMTNQFVIPRGTARMS